MELGAGWLIVAQATLLLFAAERGYWLIDKCLRPLLQTSKRRRAAHDLREQQLSKLGAFADTFDGVADVEAQGQLWDRLLWAVADFLEPNGKTIAEHLEEISQHHRTFYARFADNEAAHEEIAAEVRTLEGMVGTLQTTCLANHPWEKPSSIRDHGPRPEGQQ